MVDKRAIPSSSLPNHAVGSLPDFVSFCRSSPRSVSLFNTYVTPLPEAGFLCVGWLYSRLRSGGGRGGIFDPAFFVSGKGYVWKKRVLYSQFSLSGLYVSWQSEKNPSVGHFKQNPRMAKNSCGGSLDKTCSLGF